jgi:acyl-coenzyme A synthetase/AMP-(fatty) acid ligase
MENHFNLTSECLEQWAEDKQQKNKSAFTFISDNSEQTWSYEELWKIVNTIKQNIVHLVPDKQSKILIRLPHSAEYAFCFFAAILADRIPIPASPDLTNDEISFLLSDSGALNVITNDPNEKYTKQVKLITPIRLQEQVNDQAPFISNSKKEDPAFMVYTSGTTSKPKGVLHAHRTILGRKLMKAGWENFNSDQKVLHAGALNWTYTLGVGVMDVWLAGGHAHLYNGEKKPEKWASMIQQHNINIFVAVPTIYRQILKYAKIQKKQFTSLHYGLCSGEPLPVSTLQEWQKKVGTDLYEALGMTELSTYISTNKNIKIKPGSPGKAQPGRIICILPENGDSSPLKSNEIGLLAVHKSDPGLMLGYWNRQEEEKLVFRDDWFIGGDIASIDEEDYVWFHGRSDEIIKSFGYRVSPIEIESVIASLEEISEVAVFGKNIKDNKTLICAVVITNTIDEFDEEKIKTKLSKKLAKYKMPHIIKEIDKLPRTRNGKIRRSILKEKFTVEVE